MYYAGACWGENKAAIGFATSPTGLPGNWTDHGKMLQSFANSTYKAFDHNVLIDNATGKWYLTFGSFSSGVKQVELNATTGFCVDAACCINGTSCDDSMWSLATRPYDDSPLNAIEGPFLFKRGMWCVFEYLLITHVFLGSYFYLFFTYDFCCILENVRFAPYRVMVTRSLSHNGPFVDKQGKLALDGGASEVMVSDPNHFNIWGAGGVSVYTDNGTDIIVYHYYYLNSAGELRPKLAINNIGWTADSWPYVY